MFGLMSALFPIMFLLVTGVIVFTVVKGIGEWNKNNHSPKLTVQAAVVAKRENVTHQRHGNAGDISGAHGFYTTTSTTYYVTFQVESGDRMEFCVPGTEYGLLAEGDEGKLTFQGTRYLSYERQR